MNRLIRTVGAGTLLAALALPQAAPAAEEPMAACKAAGGAYVAAIATGDPAKVAATFSKSGLVNAPEGIFPGREAITAFDRAFVMPGIRQTVTPTQAAAIGPNLLCAGSYRVGFAPGFPMKEVGGNYTALLVRDGDGWEHAMLTYNYTPPPMPAQGQ